MKKKSLKISLNKKVIANPTKTKLIGGNIWSEYYWQCPYNSEVCTEHACPTNTCPATSNDTDGHSNQCNTTNPFTVVVF